MRLKAAKLDFLIHIKEVAACLDLRFPYSSIFDGYAMPRLLFAMPGNEAMAAALCRAGAGVLGDWEVRRFPDGESHVRFLSEVRGRELAIVCSLDRPDDKLIALYLAACVARELGARHIGLVLPYLAYMRQDKQFHAGEGITAAHIARLLSGVCDAMVTVDPHLHRITDLSEVYSVATRVVHAAGPIGAWIKAHVALPILIGPDAESAQWVAQVAAVVGCPYTTLQKTRAGDRDVAVSIPAIDPARGHTPVLVDDIASTARTMMAAAARLQELGMAPPVCVAVHALFAGTAHAELLGARVAAVVSCDTVPHPSNQISMAGSIAEALQG
jgi:ribose-phosphate pyrophosphokinase